VDRFVNVSTDKEANPSSVLGWTKRITERLTAHAKQTSDTQFVSIRFGNVLVSSGRCSSRSKHRLLKEARSRSPTPTSPVTSWRSKKRLVSRFTPGQSASRASERTTRWSPAVQAPPLTPDGSMDGTVVCTVTQMIELAESGIEKQASVWAVSTGCNKPPVRGFVDRFEAEFAQRVGSRRAIVCASGAAALHVALIGTGAPLVIRVAHILGIPAHMELLLDLRDRFGILIVENAADALGAPIGESEVGSIGDVGCFSFNGNKVITADGAMMVTDNADLAAKCRCLTKKAKAPGQGYVDDEIGFSYRLTSIAAAVWCCPGLMDIFGYGIVRRRR
jgi:hypothetical protein